MEQNYDQSDTAQTLDYQESKLIQNLQQSYKKKIQQSVRQQKLIFFQKKNNEQFFDDYSITQELQRFKVLIYQEKNVISLEIARGLKNLDFPYKKQKIVFYFPQTKRYIKSLTEQIIDEIVDVIIEKASFKKQDLKPKPQIQNIKKEQRIKICLDLLPLMKNEIQVMSYEELQILCLEVLSQKSRKKNRFRLKDKHPFQIKLQNKNTLQPKINIEELLKNIMQQQPNICKFLKDVEEKLIAKYKELQKTLVQLQKTTRQKRKCQFQQHKQLKTIENNSANYFQQMKFQNEYFKAVDQANEQQLIYYYHHVEKRTYQEMIGSNSEKDTNGQVIFARYQDCSCQREPKLNKRFISQNSKINDK